MDYTHTEVALTVNIGGAQALRGAYEFKQTGIAIEKKDGGIEKRPVGNLIIKQLPVDHKCEVRTTLRNDFVKWAISDESMPRRMNIQYWKNMSKKKRLEFNIAKFVMDVYGSDSFTYQISE